MTARPANITEQDWAVCEAVMTYRADAANVPPMSEWTLNDYLAEKGLKVFPLTGERLEAQTIPNTDQARQFALYELMPDFTLRDRDPQADERLKLYRDIFSEITAKAIPVCDQNSNDPERVRHYIVPVGPLHRAAGKLGFQLFNGERHLADAVNEIARLKAAPPHPAPERPLRHHANETLEEQEYLLRSSAAQREALEPFISFSDGTMFTRLPDDFVLTAGSRLAHRQLTVGDFKKLRAALYAPTDPLANAERAGETGEDVGRQLESPDAG